VWKNTEDEILKAGVMKYGLNQWARISSLLTRKSASQCKSRWYEWLDPSVKKTEWSREEEEKLLHLAKILPNQWRTIGPLVGRTAHQCLAHYEKLLDLAQQKDEEFDPADDPRRLRPGEIDPNPETKPARPDPIDMDEDEKEMLQEARARLANTKGKKAKRKARERQLEEARRIAALQKRRELKAAGINVGTGVSKKKKKKGGVIDYGKEIPFFQEAPAGFFAPEESRDYQPKNFKPTSLSALEGKRKFEIEAEERKKDAKRQKLHKEKNLPQTIMQVNKLNDPQQSRSRVALNLPAPQMTENELEELAKMRKTAGDEDDDTVTSALLSDYHQTPTPTPQRVPTRTPARPDTVMMEAQNLIALSTGATPLAGGVNTPLHKTDFSGATPASSVLPTPNALATPLRTPRMGGSSLASQTPLRDQLHINSAGDTQIQPYEERYRREAQAKQLSSLFSSLPKPKNTYDLVLPEEMDEDEEAMSAPGSTILEDQADVEARQRQAVEKERQRLFQQCSSVLQRDLPRASRLPLVSSEDPVEQMVQQELRTILLHDQLHYPTKALEKSVSSLPPPAFQEIDTSYLTQAKAMLEEEVQAQWQAQGLSAESVMASFVESWNRVHGQHVFSPLEKRFVARDKLSKEQQVEALQSEFEMVRGRMSKEASKGSKLEKKIALYNGGYESNARAYQKEIGQLHLDLGLAMTELRCFQALQHKESFSIPRRVSELQAIVQEEKEKEALLQKLYESLTHALRTTKQQ